MDACTIHDLRGRPGDNLFTVFRRLGAAP